MTNNIKMLSSFLTISSLAMLSGCGNDLSLPKTQEPLSFNSPELDVMIDNVVSNSLSGGSGTGDIQYSSSNENIAVVDNNGNVTLLDDGTVMISARKLGDGEYLTSFARFQLNIDKYQREIAFSQNPQTVILGGPNVSNPVIDQGSNEALTLSDIGAYQSSDENIATTDESGLVSGLSLGTANIQVNILENQRYQALDTKYSVEVKNIATDIKFRRGKYAESLMWHNQDSEITVFATYDTECSTEELINNQCSENLDFPVPIPASEESNLNLAGLSPVSNLAISSEGYYSSVFPTASETPFSNRHNYAVVAFQDALWLVGGRSYDRNGTYWYNDVWRSVDGHVWQRMVEEAPFSKRAAHEIVVFNNELYLFGGEVGTSIGGSTESSREVWKSEDGITWQNLGDAPFPIWDFREAIVFQNKIWLLGGVNWQNGGGHGIWSTTDGRTWTQENGTPEFGDLQAFSLSQLNDQLIIVGGFQTGGSDNVSTTAWLSTNGANWQQVSGVSPVAHKQDMSIANFDGILYLTGGLELTGVGVGNSLYTSTDGINWLLQEEEFVDTNTQFSDFVTLNGKLFYFTGNSGDVPRQSENGMDWFRQYSITPQWSVQ